MPEGVIVNATPQHLELGQDPRTRHVDGGGQQLGGATLQEGWPCSRDGWSGQHDRWNGAHGQCSWDLPRTERSKAGPAS